MSDIISRQAAIDAVNIENLHRGIVDALQNIISELPAIETDLSGYSDRLWKAAYERGKAEAVKHGEWIPIKTREMTAEERSEYIEENGIEPEYDEAVVYTCELPEQEETVLVTRWFYGVKAEKIKPKLYVETAERIGSEWFSDSDEYKIGRHSRPVAWMPLPKPYKEKDNE